MDAESPSYFKKESLTFRDKSVFSLSETDFPLSRIIPPTNMGFGNNKIRKLMDKHPLHISCPYLFINNELAIRRWMVS